VIEALRSAAAEDPNAPPRQVLAGLAMRDAKAKAALDECRKLAEGFPGTLREFLDHLLLRQAADGYQRQAERITLMTLHAAKGLEFPVVFIAACEDGILPYARPGEQPDIDEERRLLYVGMTRAQRILTISSCRKRSLFGKTAKRQPSPFIREVEARLTKKLKSGRSRKKRSTQKQLAFDFTT